MMGNSEFNKHRRAIPKLIWRQIYEPKRIGLTKPNDRFEGFGNIIIPTDMDRGKYLAMVYRQSECLLVTDYGDVIKQVKIPQHILQSLQFPQAEGDRGSLVEWKRHPYSGVTTIISIHTSPGEYVSFNENVTCKTVENKLYTYSTIVDLNAGSSSNVFKSTDERGSILYKASGLGNAYLQLNCNGDVILSADKDAKLSSEQSLTITVGSKKDQISTLNIDKDGRFSYLDRFGNTISIVDGQMQFDSKKINLGKDAEQPAILGKDFIDLMKQLIQQIQIITVPVTAVGSPSGVPVNSSAFDSIAQNLDKMLSKIVNVK